MAKRPIPARRSSANETKPGAKSPYRRKFRRRLRPDARDRERSEAERRPEHHRPTARRLRRRSRRVESVAPEAECWPVGDVERELEDGQNLVGDARAERRLEEMPLA